MKKTSPLKNLCPSEPADSLQQSESKYLKQYRNLCAAQTVPADVDNRVLNHLRVAAEQSAHASACKPTVRKSPASPSTADHSKRFHLRPIAVAAIVLGIACAGMTVGAEMLRYTWQSIFPEPNPSDTASAGVGRPMAEMAQLSAPLIFPANDELIEWHQLYFDGIVLLNEFTVRRKDGRGLPSKSPNAPLSEPMLEIHFEITRLGDAGRVPMSYASWLIRQDDGADPTSRHFVQMIQLNEDIAQTDGIQFELTSAAFVSPDQNQLHRSQAETAAGPPAGAISETTVTVAAEKSSAARPGRPPVQAAAPLHRLPLTPSGSRRMFQPAPGTRAIYSDLSFHLNLDLNQTAEPLYSSEALPRPAASLNGSGTVSGSAVLPVCLHFEDGSDWSFETDAGLIRTTRAKNPGAPPDAQNVSIILVFPKPVNAARLTGIELDGILYSLR